MPSALAPAPILSCLLGDIAPNHTTKPHRVVNWYHQETPCSICYAMAVFPKGFKVTCTSDKMADVGINLLLSAIFISHQPNCKKFVNTLFLCQFLDVSQNDWCEVSLRCTFGNVWQSWRAGIFSRRLHGDITPNVNILSINIWRPCSCCGINYNCRLAPSVTNTSSSAVFSAREMCMTIDAVWLVGSVKILKFVWLRPDVRRILRILCTADLKSCSQLYLDSHRNSLEIGLYGYCWVGSYTIIRRIKNTYRIFIRWF